MKLTKQTWWIIGFCILLVISNYFCYALGNYDANHKWVVMYGALLENEWADLSGISYMDWGYCVYGEGNKEIDMHENCHQLVYNNYEHFCTKETKLVNYSLLKEKIRKEYNKTKLTK